jgi:hypothetical protein
MMNSVRYLNKDINGRERENYSRWWREQINHYGTKIRYYTNGYTLTSHNFIYGEDPTSAFESTGEMIMFTSITNDSIMLSKFGIMADCDMTAVVHISSFKDQFGVDREPNAGDLIEMHEYGGYGDRPGFRGAPIYEITERDDEHLELTNSLLGHYVWYIKCKRWEYSYEPGMHSEPANVQVNDGGDYGRLAGGENPEELIQPYPDSADNSAQCIYDYYEQEDTVYEPQFTAGHFVPINERLANSANMSTYTSQTSGLINTSIYTNAANELIDNSVDLNKDLLQSAVQKVTDLGGNIKTFSISTSAIKDKIKYTSGPGRFDLFDLDGGTI